MKQPHRRRPPYFPRRTIGIGYAAALSVLGALLAAIAFCAPAHSEPLTDGQRAFQYWAHHGSTVCADLDREPTIDGVGMAGLNIINRGGLTSPQAGEVIRLAVTMTCQRHQALVAYYVATEPHRMHVTIAGTQS